ncbi:MAG: hypothetical protein JWO38_7613 [Gemmataceae bacterium]|nr:hypothetical protein [Gemmataceae bacterium]
MLLVQPVCRSRDVSVYLLGKAFTSRLSKSLNGAQGVALSHPFGVNTEADRRGRTEEFDNARAQRK